MVSETLLRRFYPPERVDGTNLFYAWLREHCAPDTRLLNLGAGPPTGRKLRSLRGEVARVVGADIDPVVLENDEVDEAVVIRGDRLALPDRAFDVAYSDFVLEHVERPKAFLAEVRRVLRPGGFYLFRTPNVWHYVALISRLTPHSFHKKVANPVRGKGEDAHEPWPTHYRLNTRRRIRREAAEAGFGSVELRMVESEPSYLMFHPLPFLVGVAYERLVNSTELLAGFRSGILGKLG